MSSGQSVPWGELAALGTASCWVVTSLAFAGAGKRIGSQNVNLLRLLVAIPLLMIVTFLLRGQALPTDASSEAWIWLSVSGMVGFVFGDMCLFRAFVLIGPRLSSLLMATTPLMTAWMGWLVLGESLGPWAWLGMALTIAGVAWALVAQGGSGRLIDVRTGVVLALLGALGQAGGLVLSKLGMGEYDAFAATQIRVLAAVVGWLFVFFVNTKRR